MCLSTNCLIFIIFFSPPPPSSSSSSLVSRSWYNFSFYYSQTLGSFTLVFSLSLSLSLSLSNILSFVRFARAYPCIILQFVSLPTLVSISFLFFCFCYIFFASLDWPSRNSGRRTDRVIDSFRTFLSLILSFSFSIFS